MGRKKMESEGLSKPVIEGQLKKKWRGEKLYLTFPRQEQHVARFCCWIVSLILLAGALTVAALIGVGVIKLPIPEAFSDNKTNHDAIADELGPKLGYVGTEGVQDENSEKSLMKILMISEITTTTEAPTLSTNTSPLTRGMLIKILTSSTTPSNAPEVLGTLLASEKDEISTETPSSPLPQTTETLSTTLVTLPS